MEKVFESNILAEKMRYLYFRICCDTAYDSQEKHYKKPWYNVLWICDLRNVCYFSGNEY